MNSNFVKINYIINILQYAGSVERLVAPDYYFNDFENDMNFICLKKVWVTPPRSHPDHGCVYSSQICCLVTCCAL